MVPLPTTLRLTLRRGTVYKAIHRSLKSKQPHFLVVLNSHPTTAKILLLGVISSKVNETLLRRKLEPKETVVILDQTDYCELTKESVVDCNSVMELSISELIKHFRLYQSCSDCPLHLVEKLVTGVRQQPHSQNAGS